MKNLILALSLFVFIPLSLLAQDAEVVRLKGEAFLEGKTLKKGDMIPKGKEVEVKGEGSFIQVKLSDGSLILQKAGKMKFRVLEKQKTLIQFLKGRIFIYKNPAEKSKLNIRTKSVAMAVRGTKFFVEEGDETYLCVCEGTVAALNKGGRVDVKAGEDLHVGDNKSTLKKTSAKAKMIDMASEGFEIMGVPVKGL